MRVDEFDQETPKTSTDPAKLPARVQKARARGWTIVPEEAVVGVNAVAAPVFFHDGTYAGAIAIVGSVQNIPPNPSQDIVDLVVAAAHQASQSLGWRGGNHWAGIAPPVWF